MPKRRVDQSDVTFMHYRLFTFGSAEELVRSFGSLQQAEAEWNRVRDAFLQRWNLWGLPEAWWRFEPDIPAGLRSGPALVITEADAKALAQLDLARRRYLVSLGIDPTPPIGRPFQVH